MTAVWIKHGHAKVFRFPEDLGSWSVRAIEGADRKKLFRELATELTQASQLVFSGPDIAKYQFRNYLMEQCPSIARRIVGCEALNQEPDDQIASWARRYLRKTTVSQAPIA